MRKYLTIGTSVLLMAALAGCFFWVKQVEDRERLIESPLQRLSAWQSSEGSTKVSARLLALPLAQGDQVSFELCAEGAFAANVFENQIEIAVFQLTDPLKLLLRVPFDSEHLAVVRRGQDYGCMPLGGGVMEAGGNHSVDVVWPRGAPSSSVMQTPMQVRAFVRPPLHGAAWGAAVLLALFSLVVLLGFAVSYANGKSLQERPLWRSLGGVTGALILLYLFLQAPLVGSVAGYLKGLSLAGLEIALVVVAVRWIERAGSGREFVALLRPKPTAVWFVGAAALGIALSFVARTAMRLVPSTGVAPIEMFISWPSGLLVLGLLGAVAPVAEELFFRGYLYGVFRRLGAPAAILISTVLFALHHLAQSWGNWGAWVAVVLAGLGFTLIRHFSRSVLAAVVAHLAYNLTLSFGSLM